MDQARKLRAGVYDYVRAAVDPVTFEVVRHRLVSISEEQAATLSAISGSPLVNDATDFNTGIFRAQGEIVTIGKTVLYHAASVAEMIKHIIADCEDEPGINPGDMFLVNHPYKGALHPPDFGLVAPVFHEGKRIAWIGVCAHQISVGGVPGPQARDVRDEGMLIPPLKAVEGGAFRHDVLAMVLGMSLAPNNMALDFRGFLSCNNVAIKRLEETIGQYGIDTVLSVMDGSIELSERAVRERLRELPDGIYRSQAFLDHDGIENKLYRISLEMTKTGDSLTLDFSKSSDQSPTFLNSTESGLHAGIRAGMLPIISYDLPWNEGVFRPMKVVAREGSIVCARFPAPVGQGPIGAMWLVESVVTEAFSRMMATHPKFIAEASAMPNGGPDTFNLIGKNQYGEPNRGGTLDQAHVGGGAYCHRDGLSPQGHRHIPAIRLQNIERAENNSPMMYLFRRFIPDTPGPGRHRGGVSVGHGYILHDTEKMGFVLSGHCYESPAGLGMFGGYPGACNTRRLQKNTNVRSLMESGRLPKTSAEIQGELQIYPAKMNRPGEFTQLDVHENSPSSGGGWGDPIEREVQAVVDDVRWNAVSRGAANDIYGVVLGDAGEVDVKATEARRAAIRFERMAWIAPKRLSKPPKSNANGERLALFGDRASFERIEGNVYLRCACGSAFAPAGENWKLYAKQGATSPSDLGPRSALHEKLEAVRYACPSCARLHAVEVKLKGEEPLFDMQINL